MSNGSRKLLNQPDRACFQKVVQLRPPCPGSHSQHSTPRTPLSERILKDGYTNWALILVSVWDGLSCQPFLAYSFRLTSLLSLGFIRYREIALLRDFCTIVNIFCIIKYLLLCTGYPWGWDSHGIHLRKVCNHFSFSTFHVYKNKTFEL